MAKNESKKTLSISAPITSETAGKMGDVAQKSVLRVICETTKMGGTGFLHKSGFVITAAHVVDDCDSKNVVIITPSGKRIRVKAIKKDLEYDLAAIEPDEKISMPTLDISDDDEISMGTLVATWGFPSGYSGLIPLLTVGYLSGVDQIPINEDLILDRWMVNAAFNSGNSGGPVLNLEDGKVIGVVSSKLAPIPQYIESALEALSKQKSGFMYTRTLQDGTEEQISEGRIISEVLTYLRSQTQLVLGHAVTSLDLIRFLKSNEIDN